MKKTIAKVIFNVLRYSTIAGASAIVLLIAATVAFEVIKDPKGFVAAMVFLIAVCGAGLAFTILYYWAEENRK